MSKAGGCYRVEAPPIKLDLQILGGRTLRQERETFELITIDVSSTGVMLLSEQGCLHSSWNFKFLFSPGMVPSL